MRIEGTDTAAAGRTIAIPHRHGRDGIAVAGCREYADGTAGALP